MENKKDTTVLMLLDGSFPPDIRVENEIKVLKSQGYSIILCCTTKGAESIVEDWNGVRVYRAPISKFIYKSMVGALKFPFYYNFWDRFIKLVLKTENNIDVIHAHDLIMVPVAQKLARKTGSKLVFDFHENYPYLIRDAKHTQSRLGKYLSDYKKWERIEKKVVLDADCIITVVEEMKQRIIDLGAEPSKVHVYQNVLDLNSVPENFKLNNSPVDVFDLVYVGGITPARGLSTVIEAITYLSNNEKLRFKLTVFGTGSFEEDLQTLARKKEVFEFIDFRGWVKQSDVFNFISKGSATIIPHYRSVQNDCSSPNKLYQYMFVGKPVISSDCESLERVINSINSGLIYKDTSAKDLSLKIKQLMNDNELQLSLGQNGRKAVLDKYNTAIEKKQLIKAYSTLG